MKIEVKLIEELKLRIVQIADPMIIYVMNREVLLKIGQNHWIVKISDDFDFLNQHGISMIRAWMDGIHIKQWA